MIFKRAIDVMSSLTTGIVGLSMLLLFMIAGSITMLNTGGYETINSMPLFKWIYRTTIENSWWLILSLVGLSVIAINTLLCTVRSLLKKAPTQAMLLKISPQIIHAGVLIILCAHLFSSMESVHFMTTVNNRQRIMLSDTASAQISDIRMVMSRKGFPVGFSAKITIQEGGNTAKEGIISPNNPLFYNRLGFYLKNVKMYPRPSAVMEISRDGGTMWAFCGGILFFTGNILFIVLKLKYDAQ